MSLLQLPDGFQSFFSQTISRYVGSHVVSLSNFEDFGAIVVDFPCFFKSSIMGIPLKLNKHVHEPAGVDHIVWSIKNTQFFEVISVARFGKKVIRAPCNNFCLKFYKQAQIWTKNGNDCRFLVEIYPDNIRKCYRFKLFVDNELLF